jgi:hypothetical protein
MAKSQRPVVMDKLSFSDCSNFQALDTSPHSNLGIKF